MVRRGCADVIPTPEALERIDVLRRAAERGLGHAHDIGGVDLWQHVLDELAVFRAQVEEAADRRARLEAVEAQSPMGSWIDGWGACRTCGGEIPDGHLPSCDYWRLEQEVARWRAACTGRHGSQAPCVVSCQTDKGS